MLIIFYLADKCFDYESKASPSSIEIDVYSMNKSAMLNNFSTTYVIIFKFR